MARSFSLTGTVTLIPRWTDDLNTTTVEDVTRTTLQFALLDGDGSGEADAYYKDVITIPGNDSDSLDLTSLTLNVFGGSGSLDLAAAKVLLVKNRSTASIVEVELGTSVTARLDPGGIACVTSLATGWADDTLTFTNQGATAADVEVYIAGVRT